MLVDTKAGSNLLYLPLDKIMQLSAQEGGGATAVPAPAGAAPSVPVLPSDARARDAERSRQRETR